VLHVLPGESEVGQALVADPDVSTIAFTGSSATGRAIGEVCGRMLKKAILELGGNNAYVVMADADLDLASSGGAWGSFLHSGQICLTAGRHLVHEAVADEYTEKLSARAQQLPVGDPHAGEVALGPIINDRQLQRINSIVEASAGAGASVVTGGDADGLFFPATVLSGVTPEMAAFEQEIFGPVAPIAVFDTEDEAVAAANDTEYGLVAYVYTQNLKRALRVCEGLQTGMIGLNQGVVSNAQAPFGGVKQSGFGREGGYEGIEEYLSTKYVAVNL
jgi:benzaldehyde dehydrogenase (NAD)